MLKQSKFVKVNVRTPFLTSSSELIDLDQSNLNFTKILCKDSLSLSINSSTVELWKITYYNVKHLVACNLVGEFLITCANTFRLCVYVYRNGVFGLFCIQLCAHDIRAREATTTTTTTKRNTKKVNWHIAVVVYVFLLHHHCSWSFCVSLSHLRLCTYFFHGTVHVYTVNLLNRNSIMTN